MVTTCIHTVCPLNSNICKMRLDLQSFQIAGPVGFPTGQPIPDLAPTIGACNVDSFQGTVTFINNDSLLSDRYLSWYCNLHKQRLLAINICA
jgi:hypothetical protein